MPKLAIFSDMHGNLTAFTTCLKDARHQGATDYLCLGDAANFGPQPAETLHALRKLNCPVVLGNTDDSLLTPRSLEDVANPSEDSPKMLAIETWCAEQLYTEEKRFIRTFQPFLRLDFDGLKLLAYHGSPVNFNDIIIGTTPDDVLDDYFEGHEVDIFMGGHTHTQFMRRYHDRFILNPGSVGLPYLIPKRGEPTSPALAEYVLLELVDGEPNLTFRRVPYDVNLVIDAALASGMPHVDLWLEGFRNNQKV